MGQIAISIIVQQQLESLLELLYIEGYFGFKEDAINYVDDLINFIYTIPNQKHLLTNNSKYGSHYCKYKVNKHTTFFLFSRRKTMCF
jgi:hypothetical protein